MSARAEAGIGRRRSARAAAWLAIVVLGGAAACSKRPAPTAPLANLPPGVVATSPSARSVRVPEDSPVWTQFDRALDPATVDARHVFLKIDTQRVPVTIAYDAATHRVMIDPGGLLRLRTTYTVTFAAGLRTSDGDSLGAIYSWQFTTIGVRRPGAPLPPDGAGGESPLTELLWSGTDPQAGSIAYDIFAGGDSISLATRAVPPFLRVTQPSLVPQFRWPEGAPFYWSIRVTNLDSGESLDGPVWRFDVLPASTPVDSVILRPRVWVGGWLRQSNPYIYQQQCGQTELVSAPDHDNYVRWNIAALGPGVRTAGAYAMFTPTTLYRDGQTHGSVLRPVADFGTICAGASAPYVRPQAGNVILGAGRLVPGATIRFDGDRLAALIEAAVRHNEVDATTLGSQNEIHFMSPIPNRAPAATDPYIMLYVYRPAVPAPARGR